MDIPMVVSKWSPYAEDAQPAMKSIQLWITLTDIPPSMFTDKGLEFLASAVGNPIRLHPKTEACVSFDEAQILVEADLTKELPKEFVIAGEEEGELDAVVRYSYPWLPPRCSCCQKWGHMGDSCLVEANKTTHDISQSNSEAEAPVEVEKQAEKPSIKHAEMVVPVVETATEHVSGNKPIEAEVNQKGDDQGWITPQHTQRSPGKRQEDPKFGEVSLLTNSYSVLTGHDGTGESDKTVAVIVEEDTDPPNKQVSMKETKTVGSTALSKEADTLLRQSLPRSSKTAHKTVSVPSTQSTRIPPRDQSKRASSKHH